ncbi:MAG TPA: RelA/SpoT family protein [Bacteroidales bacterium]|nr:RelA/SpoT family protein [Bacteroidales bacterium]HQO07827.1 RelA/SpoT family protein [Bacteroidales bacterium]HQP52453.1 RelA/SpoT family protein [Bacteroidales bacterium]
MYSEEEHNEISNKYNELIGCWKAQPDKGELEMINKAFDLAVHVHSTMRRRSKEPYVYHPIEVAIICAKDMRLDAISIACALLHDVVEDTEVTIEDIQTIFNQQIATIISGLTKIKDVLDDSTRSMQAEYFKQIILSLSNDMRVIMIKMADRLHNMRTLEHMSRDKQLKIASETLMLYAPFAYRMGLYNIKTELEDLSLKYTEPEFYNHIYKQLENTEPNRSKFIMQFVKPIEEILSKTEIKHQIQVRTKSLYGIYQKMSQQNISFDEVYDIFAIRIILDVDIEQERLECWKVYSLITEIYKPKHDRLRDWISIPKANGYAALHTTVMSKTGKWVEVQIKSNRMHEIAETGFASHHYYKNMTDENKVIEEWLNRIRDQFQNADNDALSFLDDFKLDIYSDEIYTFTPKGDMIKLPVNSSALDFAYAIHTEIGNRSIGAKVNLTLVPLKHTLTSGDQVEIITSKKQTPLPEWLNYVITTKAKYHIKEALKIEKKKHYSDGKQKLNELFETIGIEFSKQNIKKLKDFIKIESLIDLYYEADVGRIDLNDLKRCWNIAERTPWFSSFIPFIRSRAQVEDKHEESLAERIRNKPEEVVLGESVNTDYKIATCCNPIAGDDVIGLITPGMPMLIHRANCKRAQDQMSRFGNRIVKAKWKQHDPLLFLAGIKFTSIDKTGLIYQLADIISNKYNLKIRSFNLTSSNEVSEGKIMLYVKDIANLNELISEIRTIKEIEKVSRMNPE